MQLLSIFLVPIHQIETTVKGLWAADTIQGKITIVVLNLLACELLIYFPHSNEMAWSLISVCWFLCLPIPAKNITMHLCFNELIFNTSLRSVPVYMKCISRDERTPCKCTELLKSEWVGDTEVTLDSSWWEAQAALPEQLFFVIWRKQRKKSNTAPMLRARASHGWTAQLRADHGDVQWITK